MRTAAQTWRAIEPWLLALAGLALFALAVAYTLAALGIARVPDVPAWLLAIAFLHGAVDCVLTALKGWNWRKRQ